VRVGALPAPFHTEKNANSGSYHTMCGHDGIAAQGISDREIQVGDPVHQFLNTASTNDGEITWPTRHPETVC
jgi:hypothetical protein